MSIPLAAISELLGQRSETREDMLATLDVVAAALLAGGRLAALAAADDPDARSIARAEWEAVEAFATAVDAVMQGARFALPPDVYEHL
jgi:hypothetical protein